MNKKTKETKELSNQHNSTDTIQKFITEGREVLIKKPNEQTSVYIRYNNEDTDGSLKWRIILNGNEFFVSEILIGVISRTTSQPIIEGTTETKHHICCLANEILFKDNVAKIS